MTTFPVAANEHILWKGGNDDCQKQCTQGEKGFNHAYKVTNPTIGNDVNVTQKMVTPAHTKRKYQTTIDMPEPVGGVTKQIKDDCMIATSSIVDRAESSNFRFSMFHSVIIQPGFVRLITTAPLDSKTGLRPSKTGLRHSKTGLRHSKTALRRSKTALRHSKTGLRRSKTGLRQLEDWPEALEDWPEAFEDWPEALEDWPEALKDWPEALEDCSEITLRLA